MVPAMVPLGSRWFRTAWNTTFLMQTGWFQRWFHLVPDGATSFKQPLVNTGVQGTTSQCFFWVLAGAGARKFFPFLLDPLGVAHSSNLEKVCFALLSKQQGETWINGDDIECSILIQIVDDILCCFRPGRLHRIRA